MPRMDSDQIRETFIQYFLERGHKLIPSASLVPHGDPTLLFTSAGMVPFKPYFMGLAEPPAHRMVSVQKCFRTTDIESVGDYSHLTFFQMLGNFSIGDYFKKEAIAWAWELLTDRFGMPADRLSVTIFQTDEVAYDEWRAIGLPDERIHRFGEEHNHWFSGDVGPCGPNSEIFFDRGATPGCEACASGTCKPNEPDCGRFLEVWNLVFMELYQAEDGTRTPLPAKNIDTGSGLERMAVVLQGVDTIYDTDMFRPILARIGDLTGRRYGDDEPADVAMRIIAEHARAATFLVTDGVTPSNDGRGYVLRRILRRAVYFLTQLSAAPEGTLLDRVADAVISVMERGYPDLRERAGFTLRLLAAEETKFRETLDRGRAHLDEILARATGEITGDEAFLLYDTFGYPLELTREIAERAGVGVDIAGFDREMDAQRERGRAAARFDVEGERLRAYAELAGIATTFVGYDRTAHETTISGLIGSAGVTDAAVEGDEVEVVLPETPFYPEGGGQVGDSGEIIAASARISVETTRSAAEDLIVHRGRVASGRIAVGDAVRASVSPDQRRASQRNHTATHLLHAALREVLGTHVKQAGSLVAPDRLRFDFTHIEATKPDELAAVQRLVNEKIRADIEVHWEVQPYDTALKGGAMALFGEKYAERVRVVGICEAHAHDGEPRCFSKELCGGTHCRRTGEIGAFVIAGEASVGSGVRRIEALTGALADAYIIEQQAALSRLGRRLNAPPAELEQRVAALEAELDAERKRVQQLERQAGRAGVDSLVDAAERIDGTALVVSRVEAANAEAMREMGDLLREKLGSAVIVLAAEIGEKPSFLAMATRDLAGRVHAGNLVKQVAAAAGGGGGGRPDMAQAGGKDVARIDDALAVARDLARESLAAK